ncbi:hypothetical protein CEXT_362211 [Caerostris extrusa]|uniref:Uncharacterized protein n=1 Tax=Caerostris extrusa TaxID=172846 RepID=A0AAV4P439_CAEEX|nr:hypothetical protein CEXT_362211 [Caerostris extrusa]
MAPSVATANQTNLYFELVCLLTTLTPSLLESLDSADRGTPNSEGEGLGYYAKINKNILKSSEIAIPRGRVKRYSCFGDEELQQLKDKRDRLRRKAEITGRISDVTNWRKHAPIFKESIILSKRSCFGNFISKINFQRDSLKTYKFLSCLKNQTPQTAKRLFSINRKIISSDAKVAGYFLKYFYGSKSKGAYARKMSRVLKRQHELLGTDPKTFRRM